MGLHSIDGDIHFGGNGFVRLSIKNNIGNHPTGMLRKLSDRNMQLGTDAFLPFRRFSQHFIQKTFTGYFYIFKIAFSGLPHGFKCRFIHRPEKTGFQRSR